jgi:uncharacterized damage-inducible protein DinB
MNKNQLLRFMLDRCKKATDALLEDINEEESLYRIDGFCNHIRWESGHMARGLSQILGCLTDETDFPEEWTEFFSIGSTVSEDPSVYPSLKAIRNCANNLYGRIFEILDTIDDEKLEEEIQIFTEWKDTRMHGVLFLCLHDYHHGGHIMVLRRAIGKESVFG